MNNKLKRLQYRKKTNYRYVVYFIILAALVQFWALNNFYKEKLFKIPDKMFDSGIKYPIAELIPGNDSNYTLPDVSGEGSDKDNPEAVPGEDSEDSLDGETPGSVGAEIGQELTEIQKKIVLYLINLLEQDIKYGYNLYPDSGYPADNVWISTDVISFTLKEVGYDLMELIYKDMADHREDYPMDIKGRKEAIKYIDFRDVFFMEQFFKRNALELPVEFDLESESRDIIWQPGDIVFFQFDPEDPYKDMAGFVSPHTNEEGVPLVIMISSEFAKVSEVDKLLEYTLVGHFRYPAPEVE